MASTSPPSMTCQGQRPAAEAGRAFLNERLDARVGIAALLIPGGVYLVNADYRRRLPPQRGLPAVRPENGGD
ncbi:MAG: hypothetical protein J5I41_10890 [Saprospiraceae bacterium]|nr:hypothetical protein [Saprospiraceae bacterium]